MQYSNSCFADASGVSSQTDGACDDGTVILRSAIVDNGIASTEEFSLYPNPADGLLNLNFHSTTTGATTISLYDISGKHVSSLFNAVTEAGQPYQLTFNANDFISGIYIMSLQFAEVTTTTEKLVMTN